MTDNERKYIVLDIKKIKPQLTRDLWDTNTYLYLVKMSVLYKSYAKLDDYKKANEYAKEFLRKANGKTIRMVPDKSERSVLISLVHETYFFLARQGLFHYYLIAMELKREPKDKFYGPRMKQLRPIVDALQKLHDGVYTKMILMMPPRTGKSTLGQLYSTMVMGERYNKSEITVSFGDSVARLFYNQIYNFTTDTMYNYAKIFPKAAAYVETQKKEKTIDLGEARGFTTYAFRSIDGSITGSLEATELMYLDDVIKNIEQAKNIDRLDDAWAKIVTDVWQRIKWSEGCKFLAIGTNWSNQDPLARLIDEYGDDDDCLVIRIPALDYMTEKSNFDYKYGLGFTTKDYLNLRDRVLKDDPVAWSCIYQQTSLERGQVKFPEGDIQYIDELPDKKPTRKVGFIDPAFGGGDFLSFPIAYVYGEGIHKEVVIVDFVFDNRTKNLTIPRCSAKIKRYDLSIIWVESNNGGELYAGNLKDHLTLNHTSCKIVTKYAGTQVSKDARIEQYSDDIISFKFLSLKARKGNDDYARAMNNLLTYMPGQKSARMHDDCPDSLAGLAAHIIRRKNVIRPVSRNELQYKYL